jgi:CheY-like chemotaxis protein
LVAEEVGVARIMVVDDEEGIRLVCRGMLEMLGHTTVEAENGPAALELYRAERPDAVLMDVRLGPGMDGLEAAEEIARLDPDARVAMLTGARQTGVVGQAARVGARDYVVKPFTIDELRAAVERLLA